MSRYAVRQRARIKSVTRDCRLVVQVLGMAATQQCIAHIRDASVWLSVTEQSNIRFPMTSIPSHSDTIILMVDIAERCLTMGGSKS